MEVTYPALLFHWLIEVVAKLAVVNPVEVVRYNPLFVHCEIADEAKLETVRFVEVVRNTVLLKAFVPRALVVAVPPTEAGKGTTGKENTRFPEVDATAI